MTRLFQRMFCFVLIGMLTFASVSQADVKAEKKAKTKPKVQIAILLDNSGSMGGLINQARAELWKVVNEFAAAKLDGQRPDLQVALYHYGNPPATQLVALTSDLDHVSEALFGISISGGSEYCGEVIQRATDELKWSESNRDLKLIFIAGNEPFTQGPIDYRKACKAAIAKGITINTIHCGQGIPEGWLKGALLTDGKSMNINHTEAVVHIPAPQDKEIVRLGVALNKTYIAFGHKGKAGLDRQKAQDDNAGSASLGTAQQRAVTKANGFYRNSTWDLCDAYKEGKVDLAKIKTENLPENMRKMSPKQRVAYVKKKQAERLAIQKDINKLNTDRIKFVAAKKKELAEEQGEETLDTALIGAIREQATKKKFSFDK